jgi:hypothetical protein
MSRAYLLGALHDATEREYTYRLSQKEPEYVEHIASMVRELGFDAWTYREGSSRDVHVVEFSKAVVEDHAITSVEDKRDYARGYFDADGSVPADADARLYIYFAQKDKEDLAELEEYLEELGVETGTLHRPSKENAPDYWRFYVSASSHERFVAEVGSLHPRKRQLLREKVRSTPRRESGIT